MRLFILILILAIDGCITTHGYTDEMEQCYAYYESQGWDMYEAEPECNPHFIMPGVNQ